MTTSAGLLAYHLDGDGRIEIFLAHLGGPFWARRDEGAWSIPKGELEPGEEPLLAARREFAEEIGVRAPLGAEVALGELALRSGKRLVVFAVAAPRSLAWVASDTFEIEWPPRSGRTASFPEVDRAAWFDPDGAVRALHAAQVPFVERLLATLRSKGPAAPREEHRR